MILAEDAPNLGGGAVLIVGRDFDNDRHPARRIALVNDLIEVLRLVPLTCPTLDGALDVIVRHALRRRRLPFGSPPPVFAAMVISFDNLLKILPRLASIAPLKRLTFDHLLCPDIN